MIVSASAQASNVAVGAKIKQLFQDNRIETGAPILNSRIDELEQFYSKRSYKPIWVRDNGPKGKAKALLTELTRSVVHGLNPDFYNTNKLTELMGSDSTDDLAALELLFNGALFEYAHDLSNGHVDRRKAPEQNITAPIRRSVHEIIDGAEKAGELRLFISSLLHVDDRYIRLIAKIAEMKRAEDAKLWPVFDEQVPALRLGDTHPEIPNISTYLMLTGDLLVAKDKDNQSFDEPLQRAVISFQARHGLRVSGELDQATLTELTAPIASRIEQISLNLERRRWQNREIGRDHIYINLADGSARLVRNGEKVDGLTLVGDQAYQNIPTLYGKVTRYETTANGRQTSLNVVSKPPEGASITHEIIVETRTNSLVELLGPTKADAPNELENPVDVFITYVTAWANKDGSIHFRPDIHRRDPVVLDALLSN